MREPDFENLLAVLRREVPARPTLFEFFMNDRLYRRLAGDEIADRTDALAPVRTWIHAFKAAGYDYATLAAWHLGTLSFPSGERHRAESISQNEGSVIHDWASFEAYAWQDPAKGDWSLLDEVGPEVPEGMKLVASGPGGVLENVISLVGFEDLCLLTADDPDLVQAVFDAVGSRLLAYYEHCVSYDCIGAAIVNDDWGFKTQTMLSPPQMRQYVFPWHQRIVAAIHAAGKPAILHSCGNPEAIIDDVIDDMKFDGRHSYEDAIVPVEEAYERWHSRIAIMGGIDVDFIVRHEIPEIQTRAEALLAQTADRGSFALGTGNSVPPYVPDEKFLALIQVATGLDYP